MAKTNSITAKTSRASYNTYMH